MPTISPRWVPLPSAALLEGGRQLTRFEGGHRQTLTGGGLIAGVSAERGLTGLWEGTDPLLFGVTLHLDGAELTPSAWINAGGGCWHRELSTPTGARIEERGLLSELVPVPVLQWRWRVTPEEPRSSGGGVQTLELGIVDARGRTLPRHPLPISAESPVVVALLTGSTGEAEALRLLQPLRARELQRSQRAELWGGASLRIAVDELAPPASLMAALRTLEETPLSCDSSGSPTGPFLNGVSDQGVHLLQGSELAEVGVAALAAGRPELAWRLLESLAHEPDPPPLALLFLAGDWALWTGDPGRLKTREGELLAAIERPLAAASGSVAIPGPGEVLERLSRGIEPVATSQWGTELMDRLAARVEGHRPARRTLPVLGATGEARRTDSASHEVALPLPESFATPDSPHFAPRRSLHAARLIRAWVEGTLGVRPDGAYGRVRLGPAVRIAWSSLSVQGLSIADAVLSMEYRRGEGVWSFLVRQERGRVPLNLVFEPWLPLTAVDRVEIGGAEADVTWAREGAGIRLRCQFPLDPERSVTIVG